MKKTALLIAPIAFLLAAPAMADHHASPDHGEVIAGVEAFLAAQRTGDKKQLAATMMPKAKFTIERRGDVDGKRNEVIRTKTYIKRVTSFDDRVDERMFFERITVEDDTATVFGPFNFMVDGETTHCGTNTLGLIKHEGRWKVTDSDYLIVPPSQCTQVGAPSA